MSFKLKQRIGQGESGYIDITGSALSLPFWLALTGNQGFCDKTTNGFVKRVRDRVANPNISVCGASYPFANEEEMLDELQIYNSYSTLTLDKSALQELVNKFVWENFWHLFVKIGTASEMVKLSPAELRWNFRAVNICAYSFGAAVATAICNAFSIHMSRCSYSDEDIDAAVANIAMITIGNCTEHRLFLHKPYCVNIINAADYAIHSYSKNMRGIATAMGINPAHYEDIISTHIGHQCLAEELTGKISGGFIIVPEISARQTDILMASQVLRADLETSHSVETYLNGNFNLVLTTVLNIIAENAVKNRQQQVAGYIPLPSRDELAAEIANVLAAKRLPEKTIPRR